MAHIEIFRVPNKDIFEYFCKECGQLRLSLRSEKRCGNCGSFNIVIGKVGELDKSTLKGEVRKDA